MEFALLTALLLPLVLLPAVLVLGRSWGARVGWLALAAPVLSFVALCVLAAGQPEGGQAVVRFSWIPFLGLDAVFLVDGLSLFFGLVVTGMGTLVFFYASQYLDGHYRHHGRFYAYLLLFMAAMLGTVFAGNLLLLFVCWELTGIASFLLIGFLHEKETSQTGARMALLITSATGLAMLAGIVVLGLAAGTYDLQALLAEPLTGVPKETLSLAFVLIACGALGKSAQFPFHFWLPNAMAAPTPVSAYLHSATMVKLGVFLVGRIFPLFQGAELWAPVLVGLCFLTMVVGAVLALLSHDLKAILAYSTVSQLGFLIGFYGMGSAGGVHGDILHIANHVFYKGCLFMVVGIIDHATGIRDVRQLGGLRHRLPLLAGITAIAAASMAGIPGTIGFISKEYMLKEKFEYTTASGLLSAWPLVAVIGASVLKVAFSLRIVRNVFGGPEPQAVGSHFHAPGLPLQLPPALLAGACLLYGLVPSAFEPLLGLFHTARLHHPEPLQLSLWHGPTREFLLSVGIVVAGVAVYAGLERTGWRAAVIPRLLRFDAAFEGGVRALPNAARAWTRFLRADQPMDYLPLLFGTVLVAAGAVVIPHFSELLPLQSLQPEGLHPLRSFVVLLIGAAVSLVVWLRGWTGQLIALSIVGFLITFYFVLFRAPDLAMTQVLVESATLLLVLLLLARFPRSALNAHGSDRWPRKLLNLSLACGVGMLATTLTIAALAGRPQATSGAYFLEASVPQAFGTNAVNTILIDFRGMDTLLEVTVLLIATLGAVGLFFRYRRTPEERAEGAMGPAGFGVHHRGKEDKS